MNTEIKPHLFIDIDDVLITSKQYYLSEKHYNTTYNYYDFDKGCVNVLNKVLDIVQPIVVLSSDWKHHYSLDAMNVIFEVNNVHCAITDVTPNLWGTMFKSLNELEICRASEILEYVKMHNVQHFVAIDDLNLSSFLSDENFVHIPRANEGIKQTNIKEKIINKLNQFQNGEKS